MKVELDCLKTNYIGQKLNNLLIIFIYFTVRNKPFCTSEIEYRKMFLFILPSPDLSERKRGEIDRQNEKRGKRKPNKFIKCYYKFYKEIIKNQITFCGALFAATIYKCYYKYYKK